MNRITLLDNELANQIAAGEVIERPASVVKELVENSIDAGATRIDIFIYEAGRKKLIVSDNGSGILKADLPLAFARHATSKIRSVFDLFRIKTLGFRGEALPSIASIAKVSVETRVENETGVKATIVDGKVILEDWPTSVGTKITVEELFYNTPARLKYLKLDYTENAVTLDVVTKIALAHPGISFSLYFDDKLRFKTSGRNRLEETILNIYGLEHAKNLLPIRIENDDFKIKGFLGNTTLVRANRYGILTNLNGRNVYMPKVQTTIIEAYQGFIAPSRYPFVILDFEVEPELVDVNVHPTKKEVRFSKEDKLRDLLLKEIPKALRHDSFIPDQVNLKIELNQREEDASIQRDFEQLKLAFPRMDSQVERGPLFKEDEQVEDFIVFNDSFALPVTPLAAIGQTYIICEDDTGGFWLVDQHAAHERINYEKFNKVLNSSLKIRPLLIPELFTFSQSEMTSFTKEVLDELTRLGLEAEIFGTNTLRIRSVPNWANEYNEKIYIQDIIDQVVTNKRLNFEVLRNHAISTMACKASIKAKHRLSLIEMSHLLQELLGCENPYSCPHGRPTIIKFSKYELEKMFKRTGT